MTYIVDDVGADPGGSLNRAISDANTDTNKDTIIVNHGTYTATSDQPINQSVKIVSVMGSPANTFIGGDSLNIDASEVQVGKRSGYVSRGFTINSDINIGSGADASTIYINWNNINGTVTNKGSGTLHAEYNWWGDTNPSNDTVGDVNYDPWLPDKVGNVLEYMDEHDLSDPRDAIAGMVAANLSSSQRAVSQLAAMGIDPDDAHDLLHSYGLRRTMNAVSNADSSGKFIQLLGGYRLPAGAAGGLTNNIVAGGAGSVGTKTVGAVFNKGETIEVAFPLADFEGNPAKDLHPTVSLVKLVEDGDLQELVKVTSATYEEDSSAYVATFTTTGLQPGYYQVQIDLPDLSSLSQVIELKGKEA